MFKNKKLVFKILVVAAFVLLLANYMTDFLHIANIEWFKTWQADSDTLILGRAYATKHFGIMHDYSMLQYSEGFSNGLFDPNTMEAYLSQFGFAGSVLGIILNLPFGLTICHFLLCVLFCGTMFYIIKWIYKEFGTTAAFGAFLMAFMSKWLVVSVRDLYWITFIFILPFAVSLYFLKKEESGKSALLPWSIANFFIILFKALSGFEGITVILTNSILPIFYYAHKNKWGFKKLFKDCFIIGVSGLLAFMSAIMAHLVQLYFYYGNNWNEALASFNNTVAVRTAATAFSGELPEDFAASMKASKLEVLYLYLKKGIPVILNFKMYVILIIFAISAFAAGIQNKTKPVAEEKRKVYSYILFAALSTLGPISWYILASPHSYIHVHINYFYWSLPCLILLGSHIFYAAEYCIRANLKGNKH